MLSLSRGCGYANFPYHPRVSVTFSTSVLGILPPPHLLSFFYNIVIIALLRDWDNAI